MKELTIDATIENIAAVTAFVDEQLEQRDCPMITFIDNGIPYDPLAKVDPDVTLSLEERDVGGLGIYLVKKTMDDILYEYKDGQNILRIKKKF